MTNKFTHPDDAEPGHEWLTDSGRPAKHLGGDWWATEPQGGRWSVISSCRPDELFTDKPKNHEAEVWVNCYPDGSVEARATKGLALSSAVSDVAARVRVPFAWVEGRFDE